jgi:hypothetical protein
LIYTDLLLDFFCNKIWSCLRIQAGKAKLAALTTCLAGRRAENSVEVKKFIKE